MSRRTGKTKASPSAKNIFSNCGPAVAAFLISARVSSSGFALNFFLRLSVHIAEGALVP